MPLTKNMLRNLKTSVEKFKMFFFFLTSVVFLIQYILSDFFFVSHRFILARHGTCKCSIYYSF